MELNKHYTINIEASEASTFVNLMIALEKGINTSGLSNNINIDMQCKDNKEALRSMVSFFNDIEFEKPNISNNESQVNEFR